MRIDAVIPSMFHRRLLLLLALMAIALTPPAFQLIRLTLFRHTELLHDAESRLVRSQQTPTVRGPILDSKGRVLAMDRPSYDIAVDFSVITGEWVDGRAQQAARRSAGAGWADMSKEERADLVERYRTPYRLHLQRAWDILAARAGVTRAELDARRDEVIAEVSRRQDRFSERFRQREIEEMKSRGHEPDESDLRAIERRAARTDIAEKREAHVLVRRVGDRVGFACQSLAAEEVELRLPSADGREDNGRPGLSDTVDAVPGMRVLDTGQREYPFETSVVTIDCSTLPSPLRSEEKRRIVVEGVATHVLGWLRDRVNGDVTDRETGRLVQAGDARRRREFLAAHAEVREAALTESGLDRGAYRESDRVGDVGIEG